MPDLFGTPDTLQFVDWTPNRSTTWLLANYKYLCFIHFRESRDRKRLPFFRSSEGSADLASYPGHVFGEKSALFPPTTWPGYEASADLPTHPLFAGDTRILQVSPA